MEGVLRDLPVQVEDRPVADLDEELEGVDGYAGPLVCQFAQRGPQGLAAGEDRLPHVLGKRFARLADGLDKV